MPKPKKTKPVIVPIESYNVVVRENAKLREIVDKSWTECCRVMLQAEAGWRELGLWLEKMPAPPDIKPPLSWLDDEGRLVKRQSTVRKPKKLKSKLRGEQFEPVRNYISELERVMKEFEEKLDHVCEKQNEWLEPYTDWRKEWGNDIKPKLMRHLQSLNPDLPSIPLKPDMDVIAEAIIYESKKASKILNAKFGQCVDLPEKTEPQ